VWVFGGGGGGGGLGGGGGGGDCFFLVGGGGGGGGWGKKGRKRLTTGSGATPAHDQSLPASTPDHRSGTLASTLQGLRKRGEGTRELREKGRPRVARGKKGWPGHLLSGEKLEGEKDRTTKVSFLPKGSTLWGDLGVGH